MCILCVKGQGTQHNLDLYFKMCIFINSAERSRVLNQYVDMAIMLVVGVYCLLVFPQYWIVATEVLCGDSAVQLISSV